MASPPSKRSSAAAVPVEAVVAGCETLRDIASKLVVQQGQCAFSGLKLDGNARALTLRVLAKGADSKVVSVKGLQFCCPEALALFIAKHVEQLPVAKAIIEQLNLIPHSSLRSDVMKTLKQMHAFVHADLCAAVNASVLEARDKEAEAIKQALAKAAEDKLAAKAAKAAAKAAAKLDSAPTPASSPKKRKADAIAEAPVEEKTKKVKRQRTPKHSDAGAVVNGGMAIGVDPAHSLVADKSNGAWAMTAQ